MLTQGADRRDGTSFTNFLTLDKAGMLILRGLQSRHTDHLTIGGWAESPDWFIPRDHKCLITCKKQAVERMLQVLLAQFSDCLRLVCLIKDKNLPTTNKNLDVFKNQRVVTGRCGVMCRRCCELSTKVSCCPWNGEGKWRRR